jgi:hypothetical protein
MSCTDFISFVLVLKLQEVLIFEIIFYNYHIIYIYSEGNYARA